MEGIDAAPGLPTLRSLESGVEALVAAGALDFAVLHAQVAAHWAAWGASTGRFVSRDLEAALIAAAATIEGPGARARSSPTERVLHVATELPFPDGGHGRAIERWIRSDGRRHHRVALTAPGDDLPPNLRAALAANGGEAFHLATGSASFRQRAEELRQHASEVDVVVMHTHPYDAVVLLGLGWPGRPPTILSNHAGHVFWLGACLADVVACGRPQAVELCVTRRGVAAAACSLLPVACDVSFGPHERADARRRGRAELAVAEDHVLVLTVSSAYKLLALDGHDLAETVATALAARSGIAWRVVGPEPNGRWAELAQSTGGAIAAVGLKTALGDLYAAADAYLDPFPFTSQTSLLDAAAAGLPLLAARWHPASASILGAWGSLADPALHGFVDAASLGQLLDELADHRRPVERGATAVADSLVGASWQTMLEPLYALARSRARFRDARGCAPGGAEPAVEPNELDRRLASLYGVANDPVELFRWHLERTNRGGSPAFPGADARLAEAGGLAGVVGALGLLVRDLDGTAVALRAREAASRAELSRLEAMAAALESERDRAWRAAATAARDGRARARQEWEVAFAAQASARHAAEEARDELAGRLSAAMTALADTERRQRESEALFAAERSRRQAREASLGFEVLRRLERGLEALAPRGSRRRRALASLLGKLLGRGGQRSPAAAERSPSARR